METEVVEITLLSPELPLPSPRRKSVPAQAPEPPPDVLPIEQAS